MKSFQNITKHFEQKDPEIYGLIKRYGLADHIPSGNYFTDLLEAIINQQLSAKAGETIWKRFRELFKAEKITPEAVIDISIDQIRSCGTSNAKAQYIKNIARAFLNQTIIPEKFGQLNDENIIHQLTQVKGIGPWTAEMFLIFSLGREDVFSPGDAGLSKAINNIYGKGKPLNVKQKEKLITKWKPYRSYACLMLWKSLDNKPIR